jgi:hypothetical protein
MWLLDDCGACLENAAKPNRAKYFGVSGQVKPRGAHENRPRTPARKIDTRIVSSLTEVA